MGYPVSYRTSAARKERQLSRPENAPATPRPANDNKPYPLKPANDNFRGNLPPQVGRFLKNPATKKAAQAFLRVHPVLAGLSTAWMAYELLSEISAVKLYSGEGLAVLCSVSIGSGCLDQIACSDFSYCIGPSFRNYIGPPVCGLGGQATSAFQRGTINLAGNIDGVLVSMARPGFPGCHPNRNVAQWQTTANYPANRERLHPQAVPWVATPRFPYAPYRWIDPLKFIPVGDPSIVDPLPPPYEYLPDREMPWPGERGNTAPEYVAPPRVADSPRFRPGPKEKEKKVKWTGPAQIAHAILVSAGRIHGKLADFRDIVGAFHSALPKELQLKGKDKRSVNKMLAQVFNHWDQLNGEKALLGVIKEVAEDVVGGFGDRLRSEAAKEFGWLKNKIFTGPRF